MSRHRKAPSRVVRNASVITVTLGGGLLLSQPGAFAAVSPADVNATSPLPAQSFDTQPLEVVESKDSVTAVSGDTVSELATANGQTWQELWSRNVDKLPDPNRLSVGQRLSLTAARQAVPRSRVLPTPAAEQVSPAPVAAPAPRVSAQSERPVEASSGASAVVSAARQYIGVPYRWGGKSPNALDCSGLVWLSLKDAGYDVPYRTSGALREWTDPVSRAEARPGDLAFGPGHVGIYIGNGQMIDAPKPGETVGVHKLYSSITSFGRIPE